MATGPCGWHGRYSCSIPRTCAADAGAAAVDLAVGGPKNGRSRSSSVLAAEPDRSVEVCVGLQVQHETDRRLWALDGGHGNAPLGLMRRRQAWLLSSGKSRWVVWLALGKAINRGHCMVDLVARFCPFRYAVFAGHREDVSRRPYAARRVIRLVGFAGDRGVFVCNSILQYPCIFGLLPYSLHAGVADLRHIEMVHRALQDACRGHAVYREDWL